mgnify:FL=1
MQTKTDQVKAVKLALITSQLAKTLPTDITMVEISLCAYEMIRQHEKIKYNPEQRHLYLN